MMSEKTSNGYDVAGAAAQWKKQLITKEDAFHIHKTLGLLCLFSYIFRLSQTGESDMGFAKYPALTVPTILLHLLLSLSALEFKIPHRRISSGYRIWPEYRLHSIVFLARSLAVMGLYWYEETYNKEINYDWNLVIIFLGMVAADLSSWSQKDFRSSTIRDLDTPAWVKFMFSTAQFFGTANILFGLRRYSMHMLSVVIIQLNAFMMTVRRKNLASQNGLVAIYGLMLLFAMVVCTYEYYRVDERIFYTVATIGHISVVERMAPWPSFLKPISNKYWVWTFCGLGLRQFRPYLDEISNIEMRLIFGTTAVLMWAVGWYKSFGPGSRRTNVVTKKVV